MYNINCTTEVVRDLNDMKKDIRCNMLVALVALFITLLAMPTVTQAQEAYAVENDTTLTFYYDMQKATRRGTVYGDLCAHAWSGSPNAKNSKITKVIFDDSFKGYYPTTTSKWFYCCSSLKEIEGIKNLNTDSVTDMSSMFEFCESLTSLNLSSFNTAKVTDMSSMFEFCESLTSLDVSSFNTAKVTDMYRMFNFCARLTSLDLSSFNTANVTNMRNMFSNCDWFTSLDVSSFNTAKVTDMSYMFMCCRWLTSLDLSSFNTAKVTDMSSMFEFCESLTSLGVSSFSTANVTSMNHMFSNCQSLISLDVSSFNTANVTSMNHMFSNCQSLTSLGVSSFSTANVTDMSYMFSNCQSLTSLDVSSFNTAKVTSMSGMFQSCSDLTTVYCDKDWQGDVVQDSKDMFADCSKLKGAAVYDNSKVDVAMANPATGYFTKKNATGIGTVGTDTLQHKQIIYNLSGVRLNIPLDRLPAGVYIVNGHKVMKK